MDKCFYLLKSDIKNIVLKDLLIGESLTNELH